jgi:hypothetical protein
MARRSSGPVFTSTGAEAEVAQYRPLCALAVVAMLVGLLSVLAIFAPMFWFLPVLGIVLSAVSLRRIAASEPPLVGRGAALAGLGLSLAFAVAAPTDLLYYRWNLRQEARQFGILFFDYLAEGKPELACQLFESPAARQPLDDKVWNAYAEGSDGRTMLEGIVGQRAIHALLLLRTGARVRYYDTDAQSTANDRDCVVQSFAVTFDSKGEQQTFFVRLSMERSQMEGQRRAFWRVKAAEDEPPVSRGGKPPQI